MNEYDKMNEATELFKIKKNTDTTHVLEYVGLLTPATWMWRYSAPCYHISIQVAYTPTKGVYAPFACISSMDDSGCSMYGKESSDLEAVTSTVEKMKDYFVECEYQCPQTKEELVVAMRLLGVAVDQW